MDIEHILDNGEQVLYRVSPTPRVILESIPTVGIMATIVLSIGYILAETDHAEPEYYTDIGKWILFILGLNFARDSFLELMAEYVITDRRLISKTRTGLFCDEYGEILLHRIEGIHIVQSGMMSKLLNVGSIYIFGSNTQLGIDLTEPYTFLRILDRAIQAAREKQRLNRGRERSHLRRIN